NPHGFEISRRDVVAWPIRALLDRRNVAIPARVKRAVTTVQRNIAADGGALEAGHILQRVEKLLGKTLARGVVRILRRRKRDSASPKFLRMEAEVLLTQANETRDKQSGAGEQRDRERDLCADQNFAKTLLTQTAGGPPPAFFQTIDQIGLRSLKRGINSHEQSGQDRQSDGEEKNRKRQARRGY